MSPKSTLVFLLMIGLSIIFMSNRIGRTFVTGGGATTAPGESGQYCGSVGCHFSGAFDPVARIEVIDQNDQLVSKYVPGEQYTIRLNADVTGNPAGYGFQIVSLKNSDNTGLMGFSDFPNNVREVIIGDRQYVEQSNRLGGIPIQFSWTAPETGTGNVDFYAVVNAVNGNGNTSGDGADTTNISLEEDLMSSTFEDLVSAQTKVWPNPAFDRINISSEEEIQSVRIINYLGQVVYQSQNDPSNSIDVSSIETGIYILELGNGSGDKEIHQVLIN